MSSSGSGRIVLIVIIVVLVLAGSAGGWYLFVYKPDQEAKEKARQEQLAKQEEEKRRHEAAAQRKIQFDNLIENADAEFNQSNWETAQSLYGEASALLPNEQYPQDQLVLVNAELDRIAELEAKKAAGFVEIVNSTTGRFFVIVSSSLDDGLALRYAQDLAQQGNDVKLVEHNVNELPFYGVSLGDYDSWDEANNASQSFDSFGSEVWVLKF